MGGQSCPTTGFPVKETTLASLVNALYTMAYRHNGFVGFVTSALSDVTAVRSRLRDGALLRFSNEECARVAPDSVYWFFL